MTFRPRQWTPERFHADQNHANNHWVEYWSQQAKKFLLWDSPFQQTFEGDLSQGKISWFADGTLNASRNCLDRHIEAGNGNKIAYYYQSEDGRTKTTINYQELLEKTCRYAHILKSYGAKKGDRVILSMPMGFDVVASMLACTRLGLVHSVVFAGFSAASLQARIEDSGARFVITADSFQRAGKPVQLYSLVQTALQQLSSCPVEKVLVVRHQGIHNLTLSPGHIDLTTLEEDSFKEHKWIEPVPMGAEDPLFILYTSGSTGKPKGLLHTTGGYMTMAASTFLQVFDYQAGERFWCTADVGWITGHSYVVYGPLLNGATSLLYEGAPSYPNWGRFWSLTDEYQIQTLYTAPTAIRSFMAQGEEVATPYSLQSLRLLGSVGEPINPAAWEWYHRVIGKGRCPIVDTWWQTETGGIMMTPLPGVHQGIPGYAMEAIPGIFPALIDQETGKPSPSVTSGPLVITKPWPGMARTIYGDHQRFVETYFTTFPGYYFTGDGCERNADGYLRITGRIDDVVNVAGHRLGTAEVESALVKHPKVAEAGVVGIDDDIKGQALCCFVRLAEVNGEETVGVTANLVTELMEMVVQEIGKFARPKEILVVEDLPKTRSGKIMRRILRKLATGDISNMGDLSTLQAPDLIPRLIEQVHRQR